MESDSPPKVPDVLPEEEEIASIAHDPPPPVRDGVTENKSMYDTQKSGISLAEQPDVASLPESDETTVANCTYTERARRRRIAHISRSHISTNPCTERTRRSQVETPAVLSHNNAHET